ncbi:MAG TPA: glycosyltransferase family 9 protein [Vicinamibacteria bacterium]|nr:glycosyltransferase family 9 protein [Vicinamibacteria bacterium]
MKALLVRLSSIGDVVHTLPALAALHRAGWETGWVVEPPARVLLEQNPLLDQVIAAPSRRAFDWLRAFAALGSVRARRYDAALDFQGLWKSAAWARLAGASRVIGWERAARREAGSARLLGETVTRIGAGHVIDKNLALLGPLGIDAVGLREFPLPFSAEAVARVDAFLQGQGGDGFVVLNPGGGWASKLWPAELHGQLARELRGLGLPALVSFGPGEEELADRVVAASSGAAVRSFPTTLLDYVELARRARLVVAADTGPLHLACAVGTPVVALFGPTEPARNGPFAADDVVVRRAPACAPCYSRSCARHVGVMDGISLEEVRAAVERRLALARA